MMANILDVPEKRFVLDFIERNRHALALLSDSIFYFGELGMQEHRSSALMSEMLEEHGFAVKRGISGFPTGFLATYGSGTPVIAIHTEYDANPSNSQNSGVTERVGDRTRRAGPLRRPQHQRRGPRRGVARAAPRDGALQASRHAKSFRRAGGGAAFEPALFRARRAISTMSMWRFTITSPASSVRPMG